MAVTECGLKIACWPCITGHRSTNCKHNGERVMLLVNRPGRPLSACPHMKGATCVECRRSQYCLVIPKNGDWIDSYALAPQSSQPAGFDINDVMMKNPDVTRTKWEGRTDVIFISPEALKTGRNQPPRRQNSIHPGVTRREKKEALRRQNGAGHTTMEALDLQVQLPPAMYNPLPAFPMGPAAQDPGIYPPGPQPSQPFFGSDPFNAGMPPYEQLAGFQPAMEQAPQPSIESPDSAYTWDPTIPMTRGPSSAGIPDQQLQMPGPEGDPVLKMEPGRPQNNLTQLPVFNEAEMGLQSWQMLNYHPNHMDQGLQHATPAPGPLDFNYHMGSWPQEFQSFVPVSGPASPTALGNISPSALMTQLMDNFDLGSAPAMAHMQLSHMESIHQVAPAPVVQQAHQMPQVPQASPMLQAQQAHYMPPAQQTIDGLQAPTAHQNPQVSQVSQVPQATQVPQRPQAAQAPLDFQVPEQSVPSTPIPQRQQQQQQVPREVPDLNNSQKSQESSAQDPPMPGMSLNQNSYFSISNSNFLTPQCVFGDDCECVGCETHEDNEATRRHVRKLMESFASHMKIPGPVYLPVGPEEEDSKSSVPDSLAKEPTSHSRERRRSFPQHKPLRRRHKRGSF